MIKTLIQGVSTLFTSWIGLKQAKHQAEAARAKALAQTEADWDLEALRASKSSIKDELIMIIWFSPMYVSWYNAAESRLATSQEWVTAVNTLPHWWWFGAFGILAATFGLRWYFKQQDFKSKDALGGKNE